MIHFVHYSARPAGIEVLLPQIIRGLPEYNFAAFVIRPYAYEDNIYRNINIKTTYGHKQNYKVVIKLWRYAYKYRHHSFQAFNTGPLFLLVMILAGVKSVIYSIHGTKYWHTKPKKIFLKLLWTIALKKRIQITANSEYSAKMFRKHIGYKGPINLLYNPININVFYQKSKPNRKATKRIIYVGRLDRGKNLVEWLNVARAIAKYNEDVEFILYGKGSQVDKLKEYARNLEIVDKVTFAGHIDSISEAYAKADLLLFLSEYESFGNVVVESILCGTPVIASAIPSMKEIFQNYPEFLVELDGKLTQKVLKKLDHIDHLCELTNKAREEFKERFSLQQHTNKLRTLY